MPVRRRLTLALAGLCLAAPAVAQQMSTRDLLALPQPAPDTVIHYGSDSLQFGELYRGHGRPGPVMVFVHGGCWLSAFDRKHARSLAAAVAARGVTVWNLEYRRVGNPGGGWPGTFDDIATGVDYVRNLVGPFGLDTTRMVVAGHSAGGHFALWVASRGKLPSGPGSRTPLRPRAILALAGVPNLADVASSKEPVCGDAVARLMGGSPADHAEAYHLASPDQWLPFGIRQVVLTGADDRIVPPDLSRTFAAKATSAGDKVELVVVPGAGHFEVVSPGTPAGKRVVDLVVTLTAAGRHR